MSTAEDAAAAASANKTQDAAAVVPMETKKPSAPTIVDQAKDKTQSTDAAAVVPMETKKPSIVDQAKDKIKKKIQGHEGVQVLMEEGGLLSEVQKVVQANVSGGTPYKVLYFCLVAFGTIQFFLGFWDAVAVATKPVSSVEMDMSETLDFPTVFVCMESKGLENMVKVGSEFAQFERVCTQAEKNAAAGNNNNCKQHIYRRTGMEDVKISATTATHECLTYNTLANVGKPDGGNQLPASIDKAKKYCDSGYATYAKISTIEPPAAQSVNAAAGKFLPRKTGVGTYYKGSPFYHFWAKMCFDFDDCIAGCANDPTNEYCPKAAFAQDGMDFSGDPTTSNQLPVGNPGKTHADRHGPGIAAPTFIVDNVNEKYSFCGDNEAYVFEGVYPVANSGTCEAIHGGPRYFLEQGEAYPGLEYDQDKTLGTSSSTTTYTQAEKDAQDARKYHYDPATVSSADKASVDLMKVFNNEFFCSIVNAGETDKLVMERKKNREVLVPFTSERIITGFLGNIAIVGAYPHGTNPVDENGVIVASYAKINAQNTLVSIGLVKEEYIDQTNIFRWTGRPGPTEGTKTEKWRFNVGAINRATSNGSPLSTAWNPTASKSARVENYAGHPAFPQFISMFAIEDFVVRTVTTSNCSASEVLNSLGGAFALSMAVILLFFKETVVPGGKGTSFKVMTFKFKGKKKSDAEALVHCQDHVKGYTAYELKDGGEAKSQA